MPGETLKDLGYDVDIPDNNPVIKESIEQTIKDTKMELTELAGSLNDPETVEGLESKLEDKMTLDHVQKVLANSLVYMQNEGAGMRMGELIENLGLGYVLCLQIKLKKLGCYDGPLDGVYRTPEQAKNNEYSPTMLGVNMFQHDYNAAYAPAEREEVDGPSWEGALSRDGRAGPNTLEALVNEPMDGGRVSKKGGTTSDNVTTVPEGEPVAGWSSPVEVKPTGGSVVGTIETNTDPRFLRFSPIGGKSAVILTAMEGMSGVYRSTEIAGETYEIRMGTGEASAIAVEKLSTRKIQSDMKLYDIGKGTRGAEPYGKIIQETQVLPTSGTQYHLVVPEITFDAETYEMHQTGETIERPIILGEPEKYIDQDTELMFVEKSDRTGVYVRGYYESKYGTIHKPKSEGVPGETVEERILENKTAVFFGEGGEKTSEVVSHYAQDESNILDRSEVKRFDDAGGVYDAFVSLPATDAAPAMKKYSIREGSTLSYPRYTVGSDGSEMSVDELPGHVFEENNHTWYATSRAGEAPVFTKIDKIEKKSYPVVGGPIGDEIMFEAFPEEESVESRSMIQLFLDDAGDISTHQQERRAMMNHPQDDADMLVGQIVDASGNAYALTKDAEIENRYRVTLGGISYPYRLEGDGEAGNLVYSASTEKDPYAKSVFLQEDVHENMPEAPEGTRMMSLYDEASKTADVKIQLGADGPLVLGNILKEGRYRLTFGQGEDQKTYYLYFNDPRRKDRLELTTFTQDPPKNGADIKTLEVVESDM